MKLEFIFYLRDLSSKLSLLYCSLYHDVPKMPQNSFRNSCISGLFWYFSMAAFGLVWNSVTACIKRGSPRRLLKVSFFWTFSSKSSVTQSAKDYKAEKTNCKGRRVVIERLCHLFWGFCCCCLFVC